MKTDGIMPSRENILSGMYPYTMYIHAAVNTDRKAYPMANKIYDYLTTPEGQQMLADYGYIPLRAATEGIKQVQDMETDAEISIQNGWLTAKPSDRPRQISMNDLSGKRVAQATLQAGAVKAPLSIKPGMYLMSVSVDGKRLTVRKIVL